MQNSLGQILPIAAERYGDKTALIIDDVSLSFSELEKRSNQLANALASLGVETGDRVTLYSPNCWEWIVSYYGVLKLGAVINPVNVMLTPGEVEFVAKDCGATVIIASQEKALSIQDVKKNSSVREIIAFGAGPLPEAMLSFNELLKNNDTEFAAVEVEPHS